MGDKLISKTSPLGNWYPYLPLVLREYDVNDDHKINPCEISDSFINDLLTLGDTDLEKFFYNSTNVVPKILEDMKNNASAKARHVEDKFNELEEKRTTQLQNASVIANNIVGLVEHSGLINRSFRLKHGSDTVYYEPSSEHLASPGYERVVGDIDAIIKILPKRFVYTFGLPKNEVEDAIKRTRVAVMDRTSPDVFENPGSSKMSDQCSNITTRNFDGTSLVLMDNCHARNKHSHQTDIVHEIAHAVIGQLLGTEIFYPDNYQDHALPTWIDEGLAAYAAGNLLDLAARALCKEKSAARVTKQCTLFQRNKDMLELYKDDMDRSKLDDLCLNEIIEQAGCFEDNFENPLVCLKDYLVFENFENYSIYSAAFTWLGRKYVHQFIKGLHDGKPYKDVVVDAVSARLGKDIKTYSEAEAILTAYAIREIYITLKSAGIKFI